MNSISLKDSFQRRLFIERLDKAEIRLRTGDLTEYDKSFIEGLRQNYDLLGDSMKISRRQMNWLLNLATS